LSGVQAYERRDWIEVRARIGLDSETIRKAYLDAFTWSTQILNGFAD
jgi:hypothetical protein